MLPNLASLPTDMRPSDLEQLILLQLVGGAQLGRLLKEYYNSAKR